MRLFAAVDLPETVKKRLYALHDSPLTGARWTQAEQWHITLHFIGEVEDDSAVQAALAGVQSSSFTVRLRGVGTFPPSGKPRVLWAGIEAQAGLESLYETAGHALETTGFRPDERPFNPHLTLARFKDRAPDLAQMQAYIASHQSFITEHFSVQYFTLYESVLRPSGAVYIERARYPLG